MTLQHNVPLQSFNTFGVPAHAQRYAAIRQEEDLLALLPQLKDEPVLILGGGSNLLFTGDFNGIVLHQQTQFIQVTHAQGDRVWVQAGAGVEWHHLVLWSLKMGYGGLENLALIPGTVGAAPVQNIGAYGVELRDLMDHLDALDLRSGHKIRLNKEECAFGYRDSIFKQEAHRGQYFITAVTLCLTRYNHQLHTDYAGIKDTLATLGYQDGQSLTPARIAEAVIKVRSEKLPDWRELGNAGSFFKNPVVTRAQYKELKDEFAAIPGYFQNEDWVKIPAAWLIEHAGWKGQRQGDAGTYPRQPLVIVNYGQASGQDILQLSQQIQRDVAAKFGVLLEREVNLVGNML